MSDKKIIIISGPTAVGKTSIAVELCKKINGEIISADSRQVYKYLDIGTNKEGKLVDGVRYIDGISQYLTDIINPDQKYSAKSFEIDAKKYIDLILKKNKVPVIVGGTGLYIKALLYGLDELPDADENVRKEIENIILNKGLDYLYELLYKVDEISAQKNRGNTQRLTRAYEIYKITGKPMSELLKQNKNKGSCLNAFKHIVFFRNRDVLYSRINKRCEDMINGGMLDEVKYVLNMGYDKNCYGLTGVGYKHIVKYFNNELNREELLKIFSQDTRHYAKRQITWFSRQQDIQIINIDDANAQDILTKLI